MLRLILTAGSGDMRFPYGINPSSFLSSLPRVEMGTASVLWKQLGGAGHKKWNSVGRNRLNLKTSQWLCFRQQGATGVTVPRYLKYG